MESIEKYNVLKVKKVGMTKEEEMADIEEEMYFLLEEIRGLNKKVIDGEKAKEQLRKCRIRFEDLVADRAMLKGGQTDERL